MSKLLVGICQVSLHFRFSQGLKDKRKFLNRVEQKLRNLGCSVTECGFQDNPKRGLVGFAIASGSGGYIDKTLNEAMKCFEGEVEILSADRDVVDYTTMADKEFEEIPYDERYDE